MYPTLKKLSSAIFVMMIINSVFALDTEQELHITANYSSFNFNTGENLYEGNVKVDQGDTHLIADKVITKNDKTHKIVKAQAFGLTKLAEYTTIPKPGDPIFKAKAKLITFYPPSFVVKLEGDVRVSQAENSFQGPVIIYNMKDQVVTAPASKLGRATIVIEPDKIKS